MFLPEDIPRSPSNRIPTSARGLQLKLFEKVISDLLQHVTPSFVRIPGRPSDSWPWDLLPPDAAPPSDSAKGLRKKQQLRSIMQCIMSVLPDYGKSEKIRIVDFGGGTGHLSLPLALLLPHCEVTLVDLKAASLRIVHERSRKLGEISSGGDDPQELSKKLCYPRGAEVTQHDHIKRPCVGIPNLFTYHGSMESYPEDFDIGVALHACGEASDLVLRVSGRAQAAVVMAPCCVGKLNRTRHDPYIYHATGGNKPTIIYPQSTIFAEHFCAAVGGEGENTTAWNSLAKAADYSDWDEMRSARNATRRTAKALLEWDRLLFLEEEFGYQTALTRMEPWEASPKHDVLLGWPSSWSHSPFQDEQPERDEDCNADIQVAVDYLHQSNELESDSPEWSLEELEAMKARFVEFENSQERMLMFPTGMGGRHRKLIHCVAQQMGFRHWGHREHGEKTVIVAKRSKQSVADQN